MTAQNFLQVLAGKKVNANFLSITHSRALLDNDKPAEDAMAHH